MVHRKTHHKRGHHARKSHKKPVRHHTIKHKKAVHHRRQKSHHTQRRHHRAMRGVMRGGMAIPKLPIFSPEEFNETVPYLPPGGPYVPGAATNSLTGGLYYGLSPDLSMPNGFLMNTSTHITTPGIVPIQSGGSGLAPELKPAPLDASLPDVMSAIQDAQAKVSAIEAEAMSATPVSPAPML